MRPVQHLRPEALLIDCTPLHAAAYVGVVGGMMRLNSGAVYKLPGFIG